MSKKENVNVGFAIIGTGAIADLHARSISELESAELIGVFNRSKEKAVKFAKKYQTKIYDSIIDLLEAPGIDVVCICTASGFHMEPALESIRKGKHCIIEKPLEITPERCDIIIKEAEKYNVKVSVIFPSRYYTSTKRLKTAVEKKQFGDLVLGSAYVKWSRTEEYYASAAWRGTLLMDGGGALINQGIHTVDLLQWYMGEVISVQAVKTNIRHKTIEGEDTIVAILSFKNGALGSIECSTAAYPGYARRLEIIGTEGSAVLEDNELTKWDIKNVSNSSLEENETAEPSSGGGVADPLSIDYSGHKSQIKEMINFLLHGEEVLINAEEGSKSVRVIHAIYESAQSGTKINLL